MAISERQYAVIGRFITTIASAESVVSKLWWHRAFSTLAVQLDPVKTHREPMAIKLTKLRKLVRPDGSRLDIQLSRIELAFERVAETRHALVHGFTSEAGLSPSAINLRSDFQVFINDLTGLMPWAEVLCRLAIQAYDDATRGIYSAEQDLAPLRPIPELPVQ